MICNLIVGMNMEMLRNGALVFDLEYDYIGRCYGGRGR